MKGILQKNTLLDGKYTVLLFIKKGQYAETYRVRGKANGKLSVYDIRQNCLWGTARRAATIHCKQQNGYFT